MTDYISRQAALDCFKQTNTRPGAKHAIETLPAAEVYDKDALESAYAEGYTAAESKYRAMMDKRQDIIRCRNCSWWTKYPASVQGRCAKYRAYPTAGWYCAGARRREDETAD